MRRSALKRRTPLRTRRLKPAGAIQADIWRDGLGPCVVTGARVNVDAHHIIPKGTLIRLGFSEHIMDKRNRLAVHRDVHESHHNRSHPLPRAVLPESVFEFADEFGLGWYLDRHYPVVHERAAA